MNYSQTNRSHVPRSRHEPMIVHVITGLQRGGAEGALFRLLAHEEAPSTVRVVSLMDGGVFKERLEARGIAVICLGMHASAPSPIKWLKLFLLLRQWRPALVQTWMYHADLLGGLAAAAAGIHVCWGLRHSDLSGQGNKASTLLVARACAFISRWVPARAISCSARAVEAHRSIGYSVPFEVVPNGFEVNAWVPQPELRAVVRTQLGLEATDFVFGHAGRNHAQKDHSNLARAFSRVHAASPNARLVLCGTGLTAGDPYFESLPFTSAARVALIALGERDDLQRLWQAVDVFVLSSIGEAFPNVVAEAMACGVMCVVTDVGDAAEIVGDTGTVVPPSDSCALASAMLEAVQMPEAERHRLGAAARTRVLDRFTMEQMAAGFHRVWNDVIAEETR